MDMSASGESHIYAYNVAPQTNLMTSIEDEEGLSSEKRSQHVQFVDEEMDQEYDQSPKLPRHEGTRVSDGSDSLMFIAEGDRAPSFAPIRHQKKELVKKPAAVAKPQNKREDPSKVPENVKKPVDPASANQSPIKQNSAGESPFVRAKDVILSAEKPKESNAFVKQYLRNWMKKAMERIKGHEAVFKRSHTRGQQHLEDFDKKMDGIHRGKCYVHEGISECDAYNRHYEAAANLIYDETPYAQLIAQSMSDKKPVYLE